jgi:hypothetical protein
VLVLRPPGDLGPARRRLDVGARKLGHPSARGHDDGAAEPLDEDDDHEPDGDPRLVPVVALARQIDAEEEAE